MPDKAIISHRGEKYEIGRGKRFYGIWAIGAPYGAPVDRWPETRDGWGQAWARFTAIETPGTIAAVPQQRAALLPGLRRRGSDSGSSGGSGGAAARSAARRRPGLMLLAGEALLVLGVALGVAGLFPGYAGGHSLISQSYQIVAHLCYVAAWVVSAGMIAFGVTRPSIARLGALFGLGVSVVTFGLFLADIGQVTSGAALGAGLVLSLIGWAGCTAGSVLSLVAARHGDAPAGTGTGTKTGLGRPTLPGLGHLGPLALLLLAGVGTAITFAPSWDSYTLTASVTGVTRTITAGNAFANPGVMIAGAVAAMVAIAVVAALAALWRPPRHGALLLAGAIVPLAAQAVSAIVQVTEPVTPATFGFSQGQVSAMGLTITSGLTGVFWVYCIFVISLVISCAWLLTAPRYPAMSPVPAPWSPTAHEPAGDESGDGAARSTAEAADEPAAVAEKTATENGVAERAAPGSEVSGSEVSGSEVPGNEGTDSGPADHAVPESADTERA